MEKGMLYAIVTSAAAFCLAATIAWGAGPVKFEREEYILSARRSIVPHQETVVKAPEQKPV